LKPALQVDLYFGRETAQGREVSEADWASFLNEEVTPRFPDGLSVLDVAGQAREPTGRIARERTKLLVVVDASQSMNVAEVEGKPTRWEQVNKASNELADVLFYLEDA